MSTFFGCFSSPTNIHTHSASLATYNTATSANKYVIIGSPRHEDVSQYRPAQNWSWSRGPGKKSQMWTLLLNRLSLLHAVQDHTQSDDGIIDNCMPWFTGYHYTVSISIIKKKNIIFIQNQVRTPCNISSLVPMSAMVF